MTTSCSTFRLAATPWHLTTAEIWQAYRRLEASRVSGAPTAMLTEVVALVRFAIGAVDELRPFSVDVERRFNLWVGRQINAGVTFTEEQMQWLRLICAHVAANAAVERENLQHMPAFADQGGLIRARHLFGEELDGTLDELNEVLVA